MLCTVCMRRQQHFYGAQNLLFLGDGDGDGDGSGGRSPMGSAGRPVALVTIIVHTHHIHTRTHTQTTYIKITSSQIHKEPLLPILPLPHRVQLPPPALTSGTAAGEN